MSMSVNEKERGHQVEWVDIFTYYKKTPEKCATMKSSLEIALEGTHLYC